MEQQNHHHLPSHSGQTTTTKRSVEGRGYDVRDINNSYEPKRSRRAENGNSNSNSHHNTAWSDQDQPGRGAKVGSDKGHYYSDSGRDHIKTDHFNRPFDVFHESSSSSTSSSSRRREPNEDWKCLECKTWNYVDEFRCARCGAPEPTGRGESRGGGGQYYYHRGGDGHDGGPRSRGYDWRQRNDKEEAAEVQRRHGHNKPGTDRQSYYYNDRTRAYDEGKPFHQKHHSPSPRPDPFVDHEMRIKDNNNHSTSGKDVDEFGRRGRAIDNKPQPETKRECWPPPFEENGSAFVLDSRSGMFYESHSDFFYDPKSKLYYGNKLGAYYKYNGDVKSFEQVVAAAETPSTTTAADTVPLLDSTGMLVGSGQCNSFSNNKKSISIKLKTKSLKKKTTNDEKAKNETAVDADNAASLVARKKHAADMEKWSARSQELLEATEERRQQQQKADSAGHSDNNSKNEAFKEISRTAKGEPICLLCRRKFPTPEKLQYHEQVSQLHKDNLAKQQQQQQSQHSQEQEKTLDTNSCSKALGVVEPNTKYVDRAQQRRDLYGPDATLGAVVKTPVDHDSSTVAMSGDSGVPPKVPITQSCPQQNHDGLGASNVGHQLLQKLGWKGGALLTNESGSDQARQIQQHESLRREWDRYGVVQQAVASQRPRSMVDGGLGSS